MSSWSVEYTVEAKEDLKALDHSQQIDVLKAIKRVSENPLPNTEGGYGKPLGNHITGNLTGYLKIKLKRQGLRIVYGLRREGKIMRIVIISVRDDDTVYKMAQERIRT